MHIAVAEDEYLGRSNGVKPSFDPAPDCGEESWGTDNLSHQGMSKQYSKLVALYVQRYDPESPGNARWLMYWHLACAFSDSKTALIQLQKYLLCYLIELWEFLDILCRSEPYIKASQIVSSFRIGRTI